MAALQASRGSARPQQLPATQTLRQMAPKAVSNIYMRVLPAHRARGHSAAWKLKATAAEDGFKVAEGSQADTKPYEKLRFSAAQMAEMMGLGTWRLKNLLDPKLEVTAAHVEAVIRHMLIDELQIGNMDKEFRYVDSLAKVDLEAARKPYSPNVPAKGEPGYPRFIIENRCYESRVFRKIHMELAKRQDGMQVFHFVMYPRMEFDIPIFSMDMVSFSGNLTLAVCDACPVSMDMSLPAVYQQGLSGIQEEFSVQRNAPDWGKEIFSDQCVLVRPANPKEVGSFVKYAVAALTVHLEIARLANPVKDSNRLKALQSAHKRYTSNQLENDKTSKALEASFGAEWAERYMKDVMFDM